MSLMACVGGINDDGIFADDGTPGDGMPGYVLFCTATWKGGGEDRGAPLPPEAACTRGVVCSACCIRDDGSENEGGGAARGTVCTSAGIKTRGCCAGEGLKGGGATAAGGRNATVGLADVGVCFIHRRPPGSWLMADVSFGSIMFMAGIATVGARLPVVAKGVWAPNCLTPSTFGTAPPSPIV